MRYEDLPDVLTVEEIRCYCRVGRDKAYKIAEEVPHIKNGNRRLVPKENLRRWILGQSKDKLTRRLKAAR